MNGDGGSASPEATSSGSRPLPVVGKCCGPVDISRFLLNVLDRRATQAQDTDDVKCLRRCIEILIGSPNLSKEIDASLSRSKMSYAVRPFRVPAQEKQRLKGNYHRRSLNLDDQKKLSVLRSRSGCSSEKGHQLYHGKLLRAKGDRPVMIPLVKSRDQSLKDPRKHVYICAPDADWTAVIDDVRNV